MWTARLSPATVTVIVFSAVGLHVITATRRRVRTVFNAAVAVAILEALAVMTTIEHIVWKFLCILITGPCATRLQGSARLARIHWRGAHT